MCDRDRGGHGGGGLVKSGTSTSAGATINLFRLRVFGGEVRSICIVLV